MEYYSNKAIVNILSKKEHLLLYSSIMLLTISVAISALRAHRLYTYEKVEGKIISLDEPFMKSASVDGMTAEVVVIRNGKTYKYKETSGFYENTKVGQSVNLYFSHDDDAIIEDSFIYGYYPFFISLFILPWAYLLFWLYKNLKSKI